MALKICSHCKTTDQSQFYQSQKYICKQCKKIDNTRRRMKLPKLPRKMPVQERINIYTERMREFERVFNYLVKRDWFNKRWVHSYAGIVAKTPEEKITMLLSAMNARAREENNYCLMQKVGG